MISSINDVQHKPTFEINEKIVCINDNYDNWLTIGKIYTVIYSTDKYITTKNNFGKIYTGFSTSNFISLKDYRRNKLKEILSKI